MVKVGLGRSSAASGGLLQTAVVETVDRQRREVLLRGPQGRLMTVRIGDEVRNFDRIRGGDRVVVRYRQAVAAAASRPLRVARPRSPWWAQRAQRRANFRLVRRAASCSCA
jgi:hypothetical protein